MIRWLKRLLLALAALGALLLIVLLGLHVYARRQWTALVADHAARGDPLDRIPEPCALPPERNFYQTPALADVLFRPKDEIAEVLTARGFTRELIGPNVTPGIGEPWELATLAQTAGLPADHATSTDLLGTLAPAAATLDELRQAARARPESQLARPDGVRMQGFGYPLPAFQAIRTYGNALIVDARPTIRARCSRSRRACSTPPTPPWLIP